MDLHYQVPAAAAPAGTSGSGELFKSADGGSTWNLAGLTTAQLKAAANISDLVIDPRNTGTVYASTANGSGGAIWKSTDGGVS